MAVLGRARRSLLSLGLGILLVATGCTDPIPSTSGPAPDGSTATDGVTTSADLQSPTSTALGASPATSASTTSAAPESVEDYEALWERERQAIIDSLTSGDYGLGVDGMLRGPGGFELDTSTCPADWADDEGVANGTITFVQLAPLSSLTTVSDISLGAQVYLDQLNEDGGIGPDGLRVDLEIRDDAYYPEHAEAIVEELLLGPGPEPLALSTTGTLTLDAVDDLTNDQCVPNLLGISVSPIWADPIGRPWTTGTSMAQTTEALLWLRWIEQEADGPVSVAALVMDNYFGYTYEHAFAEAAGESELVERFDVVRHDPAAPSLDEEMSRIAELQPDVFISMTAGNPCLLAVEEAAELDLAATTVLRFTPSICAESNPYLRPAGDAGDGWLVVEGGLKDPTDEVWADDPWVAFVNSEVEAEGVDTTVGQMAEGYGFRGWAIHQILEIAANLEGGVTRTNLLLAQRGFAGMTHPMLHPGVTFAMNGTSDPYFIEGSPIAAYDAEADRWRELGVIDVDGQTPPCAWQLDTGRCGSG